MARRMIDDFADHPIDEELAQLNADFTNWEKTGKRQPWTILGKIYELGTDIDRNPAAKNRLIARVKEELSVKASPNWRVEKKTSHELLLVSLFGLKPETKATKSQWHSAIRAAKKDKVEAKQDEFVSFLERVKGIENARRSVAKATEPKLSLEQLVEGLGIDWDSQFDRIEFRSPTTFGDSKFPSGVGLVLVKGDDAGKTVQAFGTITDTKLVEAALLRFIKDGEAVQCENERLLQREAKKIIPKLRKRIREAYKVHRAMPSVLKSHKLQFSEFVEEYVSEHEDVQQEMMENSIFIEDIVGGK